MKLEDAIRIVNEVLKSRPVARGCGKSQQRLLHDEAFMVVLRAAEESVAFSAENKELRSDLSLLKFDKEHLMELIVEEKEKNLKAKQKLVACCKNSTEKIKNQREQLVSLEENLEKLKSAHKAAIEQADKYRLQIKKLSEDNKALRNKVYNRAEAIYLSYSSRDCESWYQCPLCGKRFGSWSIYHQEPNENGTKEYCPHCKQELAGLG